MAEKHIETEVLGGSRSGLAIGHHLDQRGRAPRRSTGIQDDCTAVFGRGEGVHGEGAER